MKRKTISLKDKIWNRFSRGLIEFAEHLPSTKKGVLAWLQNVRREQLSFKNSRPQHIELELNTIWVCYLIPIEDFQKQVKSVVQILNEYRTKRFIGGFPLKRDVEILDELSKLKDGVYGTSWRNLGLLDFKNTPLEDKFNYAQFELQVSDGAFVSLIFRINPAELFIQKIQHIVDRNVAESQQIYPPRNFKALFRGWWGGKTQNESYYKLNMIQSDIQDWKNDFSKMLRGFFSGYFMEANEVVPSLELWISQQGHSPIAENDRIHERMFWDSVGMQSSPFYRYSTDSFMQTIFWPDRKDDDYSIKYLVNTIHSNVSSGHSSIESEVAYSTNYWAPALLTAWSFRLLILDLNEHLLNLRLDLYNLLKKRIFYNPIKYAEMFLKRKTLLNRVFSVLQKQSLQRRFSGTGFPEFQSEDRRKGKTFLELLNGNTDFFKIESQGLLKENQELLDATINAKVIKTNLRVQWGMFFLTLFTVLILLHDKSDDLSNLLSSIKQLFPN